MALHRIPQFAVTAALAAACAVTDRLGFLGASDHHNQRISTLKNLEINMEPFMFFRIPYALDAVGQDVF